jgi:hypothetical protein
MQTGKQVHKLLLFLSTCVLVYNSLETEWNR